MERGLSRRDTITSCSLALGMIFSGCLRVQESDVQPNGDRTPTQATDTRAERAPGTTIDNQQTESQPSPTSPTDAEENGPSARFSFGFRMDGSSSPDFGSGDSPLTITHDTGENVIARNLYLEGSTGAGEEFSLTWAGLGESSESIDGSQAVAVGDSITFGVGIDYFIRVIWYDPNSGIEIILSEDSGPAY